ncbi:hypothetical protein GUJ93_ZPchr0009g654 [Zizania palustris]|uniref:Uncharacterized protein n=1 Tax=Zizania palustris TaxID=103762 RepID=A0A8J5RX56_ZIZPA|nr:hypothetical protein GUJ93_ZPchr0009g654 [Zizania palustris]
MQTNDDFDMMGGSEPLVFKGLHVAFAPRTQHGSSKLQSSPVQVQRPHSGGGDETNQSRALASRRGNAPTSTAAAAAARNPSQATPGVRSDLPTSAAAAAGALPGWAPRFGSSACRKVECGEEEVEFVSLARSPRPPPANTGRETRAVCVHGLLPFPDLAVAFSPSAVSSRPRPTHSADLPLGTNRIERQLFSMEYCLSLISQKGGG